MLLTADQLTQAARIFEDAGIRLVFADYWTLKADQVHDAVENPIAFEEQTIADSCGISVERYRAQLRHDWQCRAMTRKGVRCKGSVVAQWDRASNYVMRDFDPAADRFNYCHTHIAQH